MTQPIFQIEDPPRTGNPMVDQWLRKLVVAERAAWAKLHDLGQDLEFDDDGKIRVVRFRRGRLDFSDARNVGLSIVAM